MDEKKMLESMPDIVERCLKTLDQLQESIQELAIILTVLEYLKFRNKWD